MKHYSKEFKEEALKLSDEIGVKKAAQQLGVAYYTLADWRSILLHLHSAMRCAMKDIPIWHRMSFSSAAMKNRMMRFWVQQSSTTMLWKLTTVSSLPFSTKRSMAMSFCSRLMPRLPRRISGRKLIEGNCKKLQQLPIFL